MKKLVQVQEVEGEGLEALLGKRVQLWCMNYFYSGKLIKVNEHDIILGDSPGVIYETGPLTGKSFKDFQRLPGTEWRVRTAAIESYGLCADD
jgi:hypothetical protein